MMKMGVFQNLLMEHKDRIYSYALYFLRDRDDAEDVTQDVFIKLWEHKDRIDKQRMVAWMMRVTHNRCIDIIRQRKGNQRLNGTDGYLERTVADDHPGAHPETVFEASETQRMLLTAMDTLPERTKSMLLLHYFQGMKYEEIGEILDARVSTVKVAVHRGRKALKEVLSDQFSEKAGKR